MRPFKECFKQLENNEDSAAECIHCLKKNGEQILYSDSLKRLIIAREASNPELSEYMTRISALLEIRSREDYEKADRKFNLTMY
ncbi:MAG: hypothetical protein M1454_04940 [Candidatus Thermoplasmatota archaeon]|nr:hypothetical protein [Candidatus Thermoplasmatota archaeon]MCL5731750.1 hypothetical protein [Candidatus Thermoplasmatota archaeon]